MPEVHRRAFSSLVIQAAPPEHNLHEFLEPSDMSTVENARHFKSVVHNFPPLTWCEQLHRSSCGVDVGHERKIARVSCLDGLQEANPGRFSGQQLSRQRHVTMKTGRFCLMLVVCAWQ